MLFGEDLAAFRDSDGRLGLIDAICSHQGALLAWGTPEEGGLTCPFHGWAFDVEGRCIWAPGTGDNRAYLAGWDVKAYPLLEAGGLLWTCLADQPGPAPSPSWAALGPGQVAATHWRSTVGWQYALEGQAQAIGWPVVGAESGSLLLTGPDGLRLYLGGTPENDRATNLCAVLWHATRPLTDAERGLLADNPAGPAEALRPLGQDAMAWDAEACKRALTHILANETPL